MATPGQVRAVRCALDIVAELEAAGHEVRVGITTGNVYAGSVGNGQRCEYTFYGTSVNMAARLMTSPANEGVLVDEQTYLDSREQVRTVALPPIRVKGRDAPMRVYRPQRGQASSTHRTAPGGVQGRKAEQRRLQARVEAVSKGAGGFVLVEGEAGMGKTALLRDLEKLAQLHGVHVLKGLTLTRTRTRTRTRSRSRTLTLTRTLP